MIETNVQIDNIYRYKIHSKTFFMKQFVLLLIMCSWSMMLAQAECVYEQTVSGEDVGMGVLLRWSTVRETRNSQFVVERSADGIRFDDAGNVKGAGNSGQKKEYTFFDMQAPTGTIYYRLKQVDMDGSFSYTEVAVVKKTSQNQLMVAKISAETIDSVYTVTVDAMTDGMLTCTLKDARGTIISQTTHEVTAGLNDFSFDMTGQKEGTYKLSLSRDKEEEVLVIRKVAEDATFRPAVASTKKIDARKH